MNAYYALSPELHELLLAFNAAEKVPEKTMVMANIVRKVLADPPSQPTADFVIAECIVRPAFIRLGLRLVLLASEPVKEELRKKLAEYELFSEIVHFAKVTNTHLSRAEIVALGNYMSTFEQGREEVEQFVVYALSSPEMLPLDRARVMKQFGVEHINI